MHGRRLHGRVEEEFAITIADPDGRTSAATTRDLSDCGLRISSEHPMGRGQRLSARIGMPFGELPLAGEVVWVKTDSMGESTAGIRLEPLDESERKPYISHLATRSALMDPSQLDALFRTTRAVASERDRKKLLRTIVQNGVELLGGTTGGIYEYRPRQRKLGLILDLNHSEHEGLELDEGAGMAGRLVLGTERFDFVPDYTQWSGKAQVYPPHTFEAVLEATLVWQGRTLGVLYVGNKAGHRFSSDDIRMLLLFADQAANALADSDRLDQLSKLTRDVMGNLSGSLEERLSEIARHTTELLNAEAAGIFLARTPDVIRLEASHGHCEGGFQRGMSLPVVSRPGGGLTGHIASRREMVNLHGDELRQHEAVARKGHYHVPSGQCYSLLAIPLISGKDGLLRGLIRADNKKDAHGLPQSGLRFDREDEHVLKLFAEAVLGSIENAALVQTLETMRRDSEYREKLLRAVDEAASHLRADKVPAELYQQTVNLAAESAGYSCARFFPLPFPEDGPKPVAEHGRANGCASLQLETDRKLMAVVRRVAERGEPEVFTRSCPAVPALPEGVSEQPKRALVVRADDAGQTDGVLVVCGQSNAESPLEPDLECIRRLAKHSCLALRMSRLMRVEGRMVASLQMLHQLSDFIQRSDDVDVILHACLTAVTAGYGLGFNRAVVLLAGDRDECCRGRMAIGDIDEGAAKAAWSRHASEGLEDFNKYLARLNSGSLQLTPLGHLIGGVEFPLEPDSIFVKVLGERRGVIVDAAALHKLPEVLRNAFQPSSDIAIAPMTSGELPIGFLIADNKFTQNPISDEHLEALVAFANTTAIAVNERRVEDSMLARLAGLPSHQLNPAVDTMDTTIGKLQRACEEDGRHIELVKDLKKEIEDLKTRLRTLKDFLRADQVSLTRLHLQDLVAEAQRLAMQRGFTVSTVVAPDLVDVLGDESHLSECFDELAINAERSCKRPDRVLAISVDRPLDTELPLGMNRQRKYVRFRFVDNGPGVPQAEKRRIFTPYGKHAKGGGIGLVRVRMIIESHGGDIRETGTEGTGARFDVLLQEADGGEVR